MSHGFAEMDLIRRGSLAEVWGLEGVDFYQEKGHWVPKVTLAASPPETTAAAAAASTRADEADVRRGQKNHPAPSDAGRTHLTVRVDTAPSALESARSPSSSLLRSPRVESASSLPHSAPPMDPYRRLALYTAPQMSDHATRIERISHELTGREPDVTSTLPMPVAYDRLRSPAPCAGWRLDPADVRVDAGQRLRVSSVWVAQQRAMTDSLATAGQHRWYFLTEDNHWAPLDGADTKKLNQCWESGARMHTHARTMTWEIGELAPFTAHGVVCSCSSVSLCQPR